MVLGWRQLQYLVMLHAFFLNGSRIGPGASQLGGAVHRANVILRWQAHNVTVAHYFGLFRSCDFRFPRLRDVNAMLGCCAVSS